MQPIYNTLNTALSYLSLFQKSAYIAFQIANAIALVAFIFMFIFEVYTYKSEALKFRIGKSIYNDAGDVGNGTETPGDILGNAIFGYIILAIILTVILIPLCFDIFW